MNKENITINSNLFNEAYEKYSKLVYSICFHILLSKQEADEAVQEVYIRFGQNYKDVENPKAWLVRVASNYCKEQYNRKKLHKNYLEKTMNRVRTLLNTITMAFSNNDQLQNIFLQLDEKERFLLTVKVGYDYTYEEIAEILEIPVGTVKSLVTRLLKKIKAKI